MGDAAVASIIITGIVTIVTTIVGFLTLWVKLKYNADKTSEVSKKVDNNTEITRSGIKEATVHAKEAASAATDAATAASNVATKADSIAEQLNGKLEAKIRTIVKEHADPLMVLFQAHSDQDDKNMAEIRKSLGELRDRTVK